MHVCMFRTCFPRTKWQFVACFARRRPQHAYYLFFPCRTWFGRKVGGSVSHSGETFSVIKAISPQPTISTVKEYIHTHVFNTTHFVSWTEESSHRGDDPRAACLKERLDQSQRFLWNEQIKISEAARKMKINKDTMSKYSMNEQPVFQSKCFPRHSWDGKRP